MTQCLELKSRMRIYITRIQLKTVLLVLPAIALMVGGVYYYFFIRPLYGVAHESYLLKDTAIRAVIKPPFVQSYVSSLANPATRFVKGVPKVTSLQNFVFRTEWIHKMPFEFTFLLDQRSPDFLGVQLFIQENPASESFGDLLNTSGFFYELRPIQWDADRIMRQASMQLLATGTLPIPQRVRDSVSLYFPDYVPFDPPRVRGDHFIEIAIENQNGALMEVHGALERITDLLKDDGLDAVLYQLWPSVQWLYLTGDLIENDRLGFTLEVYCKDANGAEKAFEVAARVKESVHRYVASTLGFVFAGEATRDGQATIKGTYSLTGFEGCLRRALGG